MHSSAIDTAARFGEIPFVEFTKELVTGVFDSLVDAHILQMEEYASFVNSLTQDLSTYINNTQDGVTFDQISEFVTNFPLPELPDDSTLDSVLGLLVDPAEVSNTPAILDPDGNPIPTPTGGNPADASKWWGGLINGLAPAVSGLVDKINDPSEDAKYSALTDYNDKVIEGATIAERAIPTYKQIHDSIAALIASNKYSLLQTMAKQGVMRLVVTEGEIETKITFSTWNSSSRGTETTRKIRDRQKIKRKNVKKFGIFGIFKKKRRSRLSTRTVTVNTAKSYQRDSSGTKVDIFGRCLIRFKTDYQPLNG